MPRIKTASNPLWAKQRKLLWLDSLVADPIPLTPCPEGMFIPKSRQTFTLGPLDNNRGRSLNPMTGKLL